MIHSMSYTVTAYYYKYNSAAILQEAQLLLRQLALR